MLSASLQPWLGAVFRQRAFSPQAWLRLMVRSVRLRDEWPRWLVPGGPAYIYWIETSNRITAFRLFCDARRWVEPSAESDWFQRAAVSINSMDPYHGLWTTEGLGYFRTCDALQINALRTPLLSEASLQDVPLAWYIPLHTGMGLALANQCLGQILPGAAERAVRSPIDRFLERCRFHSFAGYEGAATEAIGLACGLLRPELAEVLSAHLGRQDLRHVERFWHGFGRALYFSATTVLPCTNWVWPAIDRAQFEPSERIGQVNALAGLAWAMTLVNIRHPQVLESFLAHHGDALCGDAFSNGVNSALVVWQDWAPEIPYVRKLCDYVPARRRPEIQSVWQQHARSHCDGALQRTYQDLKHRSHLQELFVYRPILSIGHKP